MSILTDLADVRKSIGEDQYHQILEFLRDHPHYLLSDVYYSRAVWQEFEAWQSSKADPERDLPREYEVFVSAVYTTDGGSKAYNCFQTHIRANSPEEAKSILGELLTADGYEEIELDEPIEEGER